MMLSSSVFAWSGKADISGKPDDFSPNGHKGYYIWQDDHGFHIWTTTRGETHVFSGVIRTDGNISNVKGQRLEEGDSFRTYSENQRKPWLELFDRNRGNHFAFGGREVNLERNELRFKFDTTGGSDGVNFRVNDAKYIDFDLYVDGRPIHRKEIYISESGWHPYSHNFRISQ